MFVFLSIIIQMCHFQYTTLTSNTIAASFAFPVPLLIYFPEK